MPRALSCRARTGAGDGAASVMASRHITAPVVGVQFHPESGLTPHGPGILLSLIEDLAAPGRPDRIDASGIRAVVPPTTHSATDTTDTTGDAHDPRPR